MWDNFTDNAVEYFVPFKKIGHRILSHVERPFRTTEEFYYALLELPEAERKPLQDQFDSGVAALTAAERSLFERAMARSEPDTLVSRLRADIAARRLPAVSWLVPTAALSEHPGASTPVGSANLIYQVLDALAADRETWSKTVLLVNFDENDGYFDHVPAPVPPAAAADDWFDGKPLGLGPRVPMTIVSPWTVGGHVNSEVSDHSSVIRFLERWTGVAEPNISAWRRSACGDLTSAFDFEHAGRQPTLDTPGPVPPAIARWRPTPPAAQRLPSQEPGRRPARPLRYRPVVTSTVDGGTVVLTLSDDGAGATPFAVYAYAGELPAPLHVTVASRHTEKIAVPGGEYRLVVQGPNRFWYELAGSTSSPNVDVRFVRSRVELANNGSKPVTLSVRALRYGRQQQTVRLRPGQRRTLPWGTDHGWYDLEVTAAEDPAFRRRLTGRAEDGRPGVTA